MSGVNDQPPPVSRPDLVPAWDLVIVDFKRKYDPAWWGGDDRDKAAAAHAEADMRERDRLGRERYGTPLTAGNGRDQLVDAYQEMLDGAVYLRAAMQEGDAARGVYYAQLQLIVETRKLIDARQAA